VAAYEQGAAADDAQQQRSSKQASTAVTPPGRPAAANSGLDALAQALEDCDVDEESFAYVDENGELVFLENEDDSGTESAPESTSAKSPGRPAKTLDPAGTSSSTPAVPPPPTPPPPSGQPRYEFIDGMICRLPAAPPPPAVSDLQPGSKGSSSGDYGSGGKATARAAATGSGREKTEGQSSSGPGEALEDSAEDTREYPRPRINPGIFMRGHTLFIYGGVVEQQNREWALDDLWSLDLNQREEWRCHIRCTVTDFTARIGSDSESDDESLDEPSDTESDDADSVSSSSSSSSSVLSSDRERSGSGDEEVRAEVDRLREEYGLDDPATTPQPSESLRDFFARTVDHWARTAVDEASQFTGETLQDDKDLRSAAFRIAEHRFERVRMVNLRMEQLRDLHRSGSGAGGPRGAAALGADPLSTIRQASSQGAPKHVTIAPGNGAHQKGGAANTPTRKKKGKRRTTAAAAAGGPDGRMALGCPSPSPSVKAP